MSVRPVPLAPAEFFHIYNRGTDKRKIFLDSTDHQRFIELLYLCNTKYSINVRDIKKVHNNIYEFDRGELLVSIGAYCLMPNHFHILITTNIENGISTFINKLSTGYSMYFNKRYDRTGALFQGKFRSQHADSDEYLKYLYAYIHLNPVKLIDKDWKEKGSIDSIKSYNYASSYNYSSLKDYLDISRPEGLILDTKPFPEYFTSHESMQNELFDWLTYSDFQTNQTNQTNNVAKQPSLQGHLK